MIAEAGLLEGLQMELTTVDSLSHALPPLAPIEEMGLTKSLRHEGCRESVKVVVYDGKYVIVDGHNRYRICKEFGIPFKVEVLPIESIEDARTWLIETQLGRRNVSDFVKCEFVLPMRETLIKEGRRRQGWRKRECDVSSNLMKREEKVDTQKTIAKMAGVSVGTLVSTKWLIENAAERTKEDLRKGAISIYMAYTQTRDLLRSDDEETRQKVFSGELTIQEIVEARKKEAERRIAEEAEALKKGAFPEEGSEDDVDDVDDICNAEYGGYREDIPELDEVLQRNRHSESVASASTTPSRPDFSEQNSALPTTQLTVQPFTHTSVQPSNPADSNIVSFPQQQQPKWCIDDYVSEPDDYVPPTTPYVRHDPDDIPLEQRNIDLGPLTGPHSTSKIEPYELDIDPFGYPDFDEWEDAFSRRTDGFTDYVEEMFSKLSELDLPLNAAKRIAAVLEECTTKINEKYEEVFAHEKE